MNTIQEIDAAFRLESKFLTTATDYWFKGLERKATWAKNALHDFHDMTMHYHPYPSVLTLGYIYMNYLSCDFALSDHQERLVPVFKEYKTDIFEKVASHPNTKDTNFLKGVMKHTDVGAGKTRAILSFLNLPENSALRTEYIEALMMWTPLIWPPDDKPMTPS